MKTVDLVSLLRPGNLAIAAAAVTIGFYMSGGKLVFEAFLAVVSAALIMGGGNVINAYFDRKLDKINPLKKNPISTGAVSPRTGQWLACLLFGTGLATAFLLKNTVTVGIGVLAIGLLYVYTPWLKHKGLLNGFASNITIAALIGLLFMYGWTVSGTGVQVFLDSVVYASLFAALATVAREIVKGITDRSSDAKAGILTIATRYGVRKAAAAASLTIFILVLVSPLPFIFGLVSELYVPLVLATDLLFLLSALSISIDLSERNANSIRKRIRQAMIVGLAAFIFGSGIISQNGALLAQIGGTFVTIVRNSQFVVLLNNFVILSVALLVVLTPLVSYRTGKAAKTGKLE